MPVFTAFKSIEYKNPPRGPVIIPFLCIPIAQLNYREAFPVGSFALKMVNGSELGTFN